MTQPKAVHFGAGNIGRGFVGLLLHQAGYEVVFADVAAPLIDALASQPSYRVIEVGGAGTVHEVDNYRAVNSADDAEAAAEEVATAEVVTTAVGVRILQYIAPVIADGLRRRDATLPPVAVMACENAISATDILAEEVAKHCSPDDLAKAVFANTAVDRIVPAQDPNAGLDVTVEEYNEWAIDVTPFAGNPPTIGGAHFVSDLAPYIERKLFTVNTGHATTAWYGQAAGHEKISDAIGDPEVLARVKAVLAETAALVVAKHGFDAAEHDAYVTKILGRFANEGLPDTVGRVGRGPMRKLSRNDRFISPAAELAELGETPEALVAAVGAGLRFRSDDDPEVATLAGILADQAPEQAVTTVTGIEAGHPLYQLLVEVFRAG